MATRSDSQAGSGSQAYRIKGSKASAQRVGRLIREARLAKGITQEALSREINMSKNIVANWEQGICRPDFDLIPHLCRILGISIYDFMGMEEPVHSIQPVLPTDEEKLLTNYRKLDLRHRMYISHIVSTYVRDFTGEHLEDLKQFTIGLNETEMPFAAGYGDCNLMEGENDTRIGFYKAGSIPDAASFVATVSGTSMEPTFHSGDKVFVERTPALEAGEIGLFILNGEGLIKELRKDGLYSHNRKAKPKLFNEGDDFYIIGKVLRKVTPDDCISSEELDDVEKLYEEGEIKVR